MLIVLPAAGAAALGIKAGEYVRIRLGVAAATLLVTPIDGVTVKAWGMVKP